MTPPLSGGRTELNSFCRANAVKIGHRLAVLDIFSEIAAAFDDKVFLLLRAVDSSPEVVIPMQTDGVANGLRVFFQMMTQDFSRKNKKRIQDTYP